MFDWCFTPRKPPPGLFSFRIEPVLALYSESPKIWPMSGYLSGIKALFWVNFPVTFMTRIIAGRRPREMSVLFLSARLRVSSPVFPNCRDLCVRLRAPPPAFDCTKLCQYWTSFKSPTLWMVGWGSADRSLWSKWGTCKQLHFRTAARKHTCACMLVHDTVQQWQMVSQEGEILGYLSHLQNNSVHQIVYITS